MYSIRYLAQNRIEKQADTIKRLTESLLRTVYPQAVDAEANIMAEYLWSEIH